MRVFLAAIFSFLFLSFSLFSFFANKFSGDPALYPQELGEFMQNLSEDQGDILDKFLQYWNDSTFSTQEKLVIIDFSQKLEKKKARPYPHFISMMQSMMVLKEKPISSQNYQKWIEGLNFYLENRKTSLGTINDLFEFSYNLYNENIVYKSTSKIWKASSRQYTIISDSGLFVDFQNTNLSCFVLKDSINLYNTKGRVFPASNLWNGQGGLVTWERAGFNRDQVFATLSNYSINLSKSEYAAQHVTFTNKNYFDKPLDGEIEDQVRQLKEPDDASFPKFYSYTKTFKINNLYEGINYAGGLSMQGIKLVGTGTREAPAKLYIYRKDSLVLEASSLYFGFKPDRVSSDRTTISIKLRHDSIYHPDLFFTFRTNIRELTLLKTDNFSSLSPYYNSYHKVDMNFDQLVWNLDEDFMRFSGVKGASIGNATFESINYFNFQRFIDLQMMDKVHPLVSIKSFSKKWGSEEFLVQDYADYLKMPITTVKHLIMRMAYNGFVFYDNNTEMVTIKPRLHDFLAASINKIDYDVIGFTSTVEAPLENAVFDLRNYDMTINGIPKIFVSDSQNVIIYPKNNTIILKQNRDFQFDGTVVAGLLTLHGQNLFFSYDSFKINLQNIDSVNIDFMTGKLDNYGLPVIARVKNSLQNVTGEILIDDRENKSGRNSYPQYPVFISKAPSYVYYQSATIQNNAYDANDFYFAIEPFEMDSLDNFNGYSLAFKGKFVSAGIFPELNKELVLQPDYSLGFEHITPPEGIPLYGGKGVFHNDIRLSNDGLRGNGTLTYLTSTTWSEDFIFYPDSMNTNSQKFNIEKQLAETEYPYVRSQNNYIHWEPYNDVMYSKKTDTDFTMFNDTTSLAGTLALGPTGLSGSGRMDLRNSDLLSDSFAYKSNDVFADTSDFFLKSLKGDGFTVLTENVNSHINYNSHKGWFKSNEDYSLVTFPENRYISYIDVFEWDMDKKTLAMGSQTETVLQDSAGEDVEPIGPRFISTDKDQDSLSFVSPRSYYDYKNNYINATGVKFIEVADARIYPKDGLLTVQPNYKIKTLEKSVIRANKTTKYHTLHTATVNIESRNYYAGFANYDYIDENGETQLIHFKNVEVDSGGHTTALGYLGESVDFTLSPAFHYQGRAILYADDSLLTFKGGTKLDINCGKLVSNWLLFETRIDPNNIFIPIDEQPKDINRNNLYAGMYIHYDSTHIYPALFTPRKNYSDKPLISAKGFLYYDRAQGLYKIGSKEKIDSFQLSEDYLSFQRGDCKLYGEGKINLGEDLGQLSLTNYGIIRHDINENKTELDIVMAIDFHMSDAMVDLMGKEIDSVPNLEAVDLTRSVYTKTMNAWVGAEKANNFRDELNLFGTIKSLPQQLKHTILLNELKLVWNDETNSYHSIGKIGIASINEIQINKKVEGFLELRIKRSGDMMDLYLKIDPQTYYYFGYTRGVMQTLSSNRTYVETIMNMKEKDRKLKTENNKTPYNYLISTDVKKNNFIGRWRDLVSGNTSIEEE